ncbi:MAG TPA: AAA family ATPase [Candidatus Acidoferrales bacterium]|nr:AAA family ATPase [Candidatus Acidoferrales bacterium]
MYRKFYGLTRNPFEISPDPYFFYPTSRHNEALANLNYGVQRRKGFVVVTGEVGTGKTLLVRCLLDSLNRNQIAFAYVFNPRLSVPDFLRYMLTDLRLPTTGRTKSEMLAHLNNYLIARFRRGTTAALVVDEAQLLSWELLEEVRLLTNLETSQQKLLQIVLVGQPELDRKLDSPHLRQLKQRIGLRCRLEPLGAEELRGYIHRRLELGGANSHGSSIFTEEGIAAIHQFSHGIPRLINTLCENSLVAGYVKQVKQITAEIVQEVASDFRMDVPCSTSAPESEDAESRKKALKALFRMIEELDGASEKQLDEAKLESGVKTE